MRRCHLSSGSRLAHRPQSSIDRLCLRLLRTRFLRKQKCPSLRRGSRADTDPGDHSEGPGRD
ncbi:hypothetical protein GZL_05831 [Streptomyces sp. 769]|nr:hypothetical protein GZL_05831 [Streptomyces sp. 769]